MNTDFTYIRKENHPVAGLAVRLDNDILHVAVSKCHPNDRFEKKLAWNRATGLLNSADNRCTVALNANNANNAETVITDYLTNKYHLNDEQCQYAAKFIKGFLAPR